MSERLQSLAPTPRLLSSLPLSTRRLTNGWRCSISPLRWQKNETMHSLVNGSVAAEELAKLFVGVCGEQLNEHGQNLIRVMAENGRLRCAAGGRCRIRRAQG